MKLTNAELEVLALVPSDGRKSANEIWRELDLWSPMHIRKVLRRLVAFGAIKTADDEVRQGNKVPRKLYWREL